MSENVAAKAAQGTRLLLAEAEKMLQEGIEQRGAGAEFLFPNTVYYLPVILGNSAKAIESVGDLEPVLRQAQTLLDGGQAADAALVAAEIIEALRAPEGSLDSRISDIHVRSWGVQLADGRMPGVALIMGRARNSAVAGKLIDELRRGNVLCLLSGTGNGGVWDQLQDGTLEWGNEKCIVPLGKDSTSAVHALGFAARCAMRLGGHKPGKWTEILRYAKRRTPGFVLALGEPDERVSAMGLAASEFGFPLIVEGQVADGKQVFSVPLESMTGKDDVEKAAHLAQRCMSIRRLKSKTYSVTAPVAYGPAFEDEAIGDEDLHAQFGGGGCIAFELLQKADAGELTDGKIEVMGPALPTEPQQEPMALGIVVKVAGEKVQAEFEAYLERQIHEFINYASGAQHTGRQDRVMIRVSKAAVEKGFGLESLGQIIQARLHDEFAAAIEKVEVMLITDPKRHAAWLDKARLAYDLRKKRIAGLSDDQVDVFYVCTHCRIFAPNNVSIISPERVSPCGECNWFDARASYELDPAGFRRPIRLGKAIDPKRGIWEGTNRYARAASGGRMNEVALYSIMQTPMGACGDFECMVVLIPEANGVMVLSHEDTSLRTPAGMNIATFSSLTAGEQIPGVVGIGKNYLLSPKFISAEGGFKRVVWMSSRLKESMADDLRAVCEREGESGLMIKIADERHVKTVDELVRWLKEHQHPALQMERMF